MLKLSCLCGRVRIAFPRPQAFVHECNCTLCRKSGARWSYHHPSEVTVEGETKGYSRDDKADPAAEIRFCPHCGCTTHFVLTPSAVARFGDSQMGVNVRLADETDLAGVELRFPDGRGWDGAGAFGYVQEARILGR